MECITCTTCGLHYKQSNDFFHKLTNMHLALTIKYYCQMYEKFLGLNETNQ